MKVKVKKIKFNDYVPRGVFEQIHWGKDIAMQQLEELGVPFGAKVELYAKPITHAYWEPDGVWDICSNCKVPTVQPHIKGLPKNKYCPYCGAEMDGASSFGTEFIELTNALYGKMGEQK